MKNYAQFDLHLHSHWSYDAFSNVEDYFKLARQKKVRAFALTDHHTMDGYGDMLKIAPNYPDVYFIAGGELTVHSPLGTFDLVCLGLPCRETPELAELFKTYRAWQVAYGSAISANLVRLGFQFGDDERMKVLQSYRPQRVIDKQGCTHVQAMKMQQTMIELGFVKNELEWVQLRAKFEDLPKYPEFDYVVPKVKAAGGVVIIAHPYGYFHKTDLARMDALRELLQLDGIECAHPSTPEDITPFYREYCAKHGMLSSGGSDSHQPCTVHDNHHLTDIEFAFHCAKPEWLDEILERVQLH